MIDIETATLEELEAELEECHQAWGKYSCDCFGFYITALQKQISNLKQQNKMSDQKLNFGQALDAAKRGELIQRENWNGKGQFVFMRPEDTLNADILLGARSLPKKLKDYFERKHQPIISADDVQVKFTAYLCLKSVDDTIINGWVPSTTDMLAEDWKVL